jgi:hypothetical protein
MRKSAQSGQVGRLRAVGYVRVSTHIFLTAAEGCSGEQQWQESYQVAAGGTRNQFR